MQPSSVSPRSPAHGPRLPATAAICVMALLTVLLATAPTWSASAPVAPLVSSASGRCLDVKGNVDTPGTALEIWDCNDQVNQEFEFTSGAS